MKGIPSNSLLVKVARGCIPVRCVETGDPNLNLEVAMKLLGPGGQIQDIDLWLQASTWLKNDVYLICILYEHI